MTSLRRAFLFPVVLLAGCATTTIGTTWRAPGFAGPPLRKVLVCALSPDDVTRRLLEDSFVRELLLNGVTGIPCYSVLAPGTPTGQQAREAATSSGVDGIIVTRPASVKEIMVYEGGGPGYSDSSLGSGWSSAYDPQYLKQETEVTIQARVYSVQGTGALVWGGTSETFDPSSVKSLIAQIVPRFIGAMSKAEILPPKHST